MKKIYQTPQLHVHGAVETLTQQSGEGPRLDQLFSSVTEGTVVIGPIQVLAAQANALS